MVPVLLLYVSLSLPPGALTAGALHVAVAEATALWAGHGVVVAAGPAAASTADEALSVRVIVERRPGILGTLWHGPLASISFDASGTPVPEITLYLPDIVEMIARSNLPGSGGDPWPTILRERAVGRAVGRVLAHELGHYLLRSRTHTPSGLMRAVQNAAELIAAERNPFALSPADAVRWAEIASTDWITAAAVDCEGMAR